jgi:hypothetical protein
MSAPLSKGDGNCPSSVLSENPDENAEYKFNYSRYTDTRGLLVLKYSDDTLRVIEWA